MDAGEGLVALFTATNHRFFTRWRLCIAGLTHPIDRIASHRIASHRIASHRIASSWGRQVLVLVLKRRASESIVSGGRTARLWYDESIPRDHAVWVRKTQSVRTQPIAAVCMYRKRGEAGCRVRGGRSSRLVAQTNDVQHETRMK